jgi:predicted P-loop ATPase
VNVKKYVVPNIPYAFIALFATKIGQAARLAPGTDFSTKTLHIMDGLTAAFQNAAPSFHPVDLCVGICIAAIMRLVVYVKSKNARKFRKNMEYPDGADRHREAARLQRLSGTLTDTDMPYILLYLEDNYGLTNEKKIESALRIIANENQYHPIRDYLNDLVWDGQERIRYALHRFLGADTDDFTYECLRLFMMGAIRRVFKPGCKFELMLCLVGGQGAGKSTFFRFLSVRDEWFSDDLKKLDDENVYRKLQGHWIIEMSEMIATANARSIEEIKSFISRQKETYKVPYEVHPADRLRQNVFGGTTNKQDFLPRDRTGNRRFLPIRVYPERAEVHILEDEDAARAYIDQMWAEAMSIYRSGNYAMKLTPEAERHLREYQKDFMQEDTQAGLIYDFLDTYKGDRVCSKQLYRKL